MPVVAGRAEGCSVGKFYPVSDIAQSVRPDANGASVTAIARAGEPDRYLAALLSPPVQREALLALAAFSTELSRIPQRTVREAAMGEIRLQWWRDALALAPELRTGHPVADAVRESARHFSLPADLLGALIDGQLPLLHHVQPADEAELSDLLWKTEGALFALSAHIVGLPAGPEARAGCVAAGQAYGLSRLLIGLPSALSQGRIPLAKSQLDDVGLAADDLLGGGSSPVADETRIEHLIAKSSAQIRVSLSAVRPFVASLPRSARPAFLPLALVRPYLQILERSGRGLLHRELQVSPLTRVRRIASAQLFGRL